MQARAPPSTHRVGGGPVRAELEEQLGACGVEGAHAAAPRESTREELLGADVGAVVNVESIVERLGVEASEGECDALWGGDGRRRQGAPVSKRGTVKLGARQPSGIRSLGRGAEGSGLEWEWSFAP